MLGTLVACFTFGSVENIYEELTKHYGWARAGDAEDGLAALPPACAIANIWP